MATISYKPLIEEMKWSYSRLTSFGNCPYGWFLKYIIGYKEEHEQFYSNFGKFMHEILDLFHSGKISNDECVTMFFQEFSDKVKGERPQNIDFYIEQGSQFLQNMQRLPYHVEATEQFTNFEIGGKKFVGVIDVLCTDDDGDYIIVDHKSRKLRPFSGKSNPTATDIELSQYLRQLYLYSAAIQQKFGKLPVKLCFNCFMNNKFIEVPFDESEYKAVCDWAIEEIQYIENTVKFYPIIDWFRCKNLCGYCDDCVYSGG